MAMSGKELLVQVSLILVGFVGAWILLTVSGFRSSGVSSSAKYGSGTGVEVDLSGLRASSITFGSPDASNHIVVFNDYDCPFCRRHELLLKKLLRERNDIRIGYYHYPISQIHPGALPKAKFIECVALTNESVRDVHESLFNLDGYADSSFVDLASRYDGNEQIMDCYRGEGLSSKQADERLAADKYFASENGIRSTPTSIINGVLIPGAAPLEIIENTLK